MERADFFSHHDMSCFFPAPGLSRLLGLSNAQSTKNLRLTSNALQSITNDILDFSKIESGRFDINYAPFDLEACINETYKLLSFAKRGKDTDFECTNNIPKDVLCVGDSGRLKQVLTNLLTNSLKFTSSGYIRLTAEISEEENGVETAIFLIEDTGIGIAQANMKRPFQPFQQGDTSIARTYGGTGLGLSICRRLVNLMHGKIELESQEGRGTTVSVRLPFRRAQSIKSASHRESPVLTRGESRVQNDRRSILLVEDNPILHKLTTRVLEKQGYKVTGVWDGQEAIEHLLECSRGTWSPSPDLVLMDIQMPRMDGSAATRCIRTDQRFLGSAISQIPIVALTASAVKGDKDRCLAAGMNDYLMKPVSAERLQLTLRKWLQ